MRQTNLFEMIPQRIRDFEEQENHTVVVLYPRFSIWPLCYLMRFLKKPFIRIQLDIVGSVIWKNIDGKQNIAKISEKVCQELQQPDDPNWHKRLAMFFGFLNRGDLIRF